MSTLRNTKTKTKALALGIALAAAQVSFPAPAHAGPAENSLYTRLVLKERSFFGIDADVRRLLNDSVFEADVRKWFQAVNPAYVDEAIRAGAADERLRANNAPQLRMREILASDDFSRGVPSEKVQVYLSYFLRTDQKQKAQSLLRIYLTEYLMYLIESAEDPMYTGPGSSQKLMELFGQASGAVDAYGACALRYTGNVESFRDVGACLRGAFSFNNGNSFRMETQAPMHVVSRTGFIPGNDVAYFTENRHDREIVRTFEELYRGELNPVADTLGGRSYADLRDLLDREPVFASVMPRDPSFLDALTNPALVAKGLGDPNVAIFPELVRAIQSAKHTIFVDIFFLGGTTGAAMARELIKASEKGIRVFLLHDPYNSFDYRAEMEPVFQSLLAYAERNPRNITVAGSYIFAHRTGLPRYFDALLPDSVVKAVFEQGKKLFGFSPPLFPKAKSDHSKVMVIDGAGRWADSTPIAYVGSKNWTDSSGALTFDEVARIAGPAAVAVQDGYYWDMWYALRSGAGGRKPMDTASIEKLLLPFDTLGRVWNAAAGRVDIKAGPGGLDVKAKPEGVVVRIGENNVDGSITSVIDQNIYAIRSAKRQIIVNDQFLYDRRIVEELLEKARTSPEVGIYIMLEPITKKGSGTVSEVLGGFPNTLYLDLLTYQEIELGADGQPAVRKPWPKNLQVRWKDIPHSDEFHMEYHMKTISVDGFDASGRRAGGLSPRAPAVLITGSANKDHMTMYGAFREAQVEIYDNRDCSAPRPRCGAVAEADRVFWKRWENRAGADEGGGSNAASPFLFTLPPQVQSVMKPALGGRDMTQAEFLLFARSLVHGAYDLERSSIVE